MSSNGIKASIPQPKLKAMLDKAHGAVGRLHPYFLLDFFLIRVTCSATDLKIGIVAELELKDDGRVDVGGRICLPANKFRDLVGALSPDYNVTLTGLDKDRLRVECGDYSGVIACLDPDVHFPAMDAPSGDIDFGCHGDVIQAIHGACNHAMFANDGITNSIYLRAGNNALLGVATDGHRLSLAAKSIEAGGGEGFEKGVIVSARALGKIGLLSPHFCEIRVGESVMSFEQPNISLIGRLMEGEYPAFRKAIPTAHPHCCVVDARSLIERIERVGVLAESDSVELDISPGDDDNGDIQITAESTAGPLQDLVPAEVTGKPVKIRVTPRYLIEALRSLAKDSRDVVIKYDVELPDSDKKPPLVLIPADHSAWNERIEVIMPRGR